jgi:hypothetical protein
MATAVYWLQYVAVGQSADISHVLLLWLLWGLRCPGELELSIQACYPLPRKQSHCLELSGFSHNVLFVFEWGKHPPSCVSVAMMENVYFV